MAQCGGGWKCIFTDILGIAGIGCIDGYSLDDLMPVDHVKKNRKLVF